MSAGLYPLTIEVGATTERTFTWKDSSGALVDLTGWSAVVALGRALGDYAPVLTLSPVLGGAAGTIGVTITPAQSVNAKSCRVWELKMTDGAGRVTRLLEGPVRVKEEVSQ